MIAVSQEILDSLESNNRLWRVKVEITRNNTGATPIDISDRVNSCDVSFDFERRGGSASLEIDNYDHSLSPLNETSVTNQVGGVYDPLLDAKHTVVIYYGIETASGYEYIKRFTGVLGDEIDAETYPGSITVTARDRSKELQDTYIYQSKAYGGAMVVEQVMQDIIDEFLPDSGITVQVESPTLFAIGKPGSPYVAKDINLWDALQTLADACNHELRFLEDGTLRLRKIEMDLHNSTPVRIFDESELSKDTISISDSEVRNHIVLRVQGLDPVERENQDSIDKYGRRYMEVNRSMANVITTLEQAHDFVDKLIKDLSYANPIDNIELPFYPIVQVDDVIAVNNSRSGTNEINHIFRVIRTRDSFSADRKRTVISLQGYKRVDPEASIAPNQPTNITGVMQTREIQNYEGSGWEGNSKTIFFPRIEWTPPATDISGNALSADFGGYTIYRKHSSESTYYPIASIKSYIESLALQTDYFYDYTASIGSNNYKMVAINRYGKKSSETTPISIEISPASYQ